MVLNILKYLKNWYHKYLEKKEIDRLLDKHGCVLYCQYCHQILYDGHYLSNGLFSCKCKCGRDSVFLLDAPVPICIKDS